MLTTRPVISTFPVCGTLGFTQEPGDHDFATLEGEDLTLETCRMACIRNGTCQAVSYAQIYSLCSFYSEPMECDQLLADNSSYFAHYDNACPFPRNDEGEQSSS
jgi:PAN-like domain